MPDVRSTLQASLGTRYTLERELGGGGMSRVFVADETALGRKVVVKVLPPELAAGVNVGRFNREIQLAAQLQHPCIVPVLSAGVSDGLPYYTMPYVEGESLRARLARTGAMAVGEAVAILRDVARALSAAHERGVVHRDIKPDNVLLARHHALVADFGVAKALSASSEERGAGGTTSLGIALGTPAYMAPEQAVADPLIDHRADIYGLGAMAYEMLTGVPLFGQRSPSALLAAQVTERPVPIEQRRADLPPALAALVTTCLEKNPDDRPQSADAVLAVLDAVVAPAGDGALADGAGPSVVVGRVSLVRAAVLYAAALIAVVALAKVATDQLGLPDWVMPGSILIMALILPAVALTALAHRPAPPRTPRTPLTPRTPAPGGDSPRRAGTGGADPGTGTRLAERARPWLTWPRTVKAGAAALALFAALVATRATLHHLGIGPEGSLVAAGKLGTRDRILVSDFRAAGRDSLLGAVVTEALRTDLGQSRVVTTMQPSALQAALVRMQRPAGTAIDAALARQIATREGVKAVVEGDIASVGGGYLLTARLVAPSTGDVLASFRESADGERDIIPAIDRLSQKVRERIGESLKTIRGEAPLAQVTTASLDALQRYTQGVHAMDAEGDIPKATTLLEHAVRLDTTFAMAYRKLGVAYQRQGDQPARMAAMFRKAFDYRDRLPDAERYLAEGSYYSFGPAPDAQKALAAFEALLGLDPGNVAALNNAALLYSYQRDFGRAEAYLTRAVSADSSSPVYFSGLIDAQVNARSLQAARATLAAARARFPRNPTTLRDGIFLAAVDGRYDEAARQVAALRDARRADHATRTSTSVMLAALAFTRGRVAAAEREMREAIASDRARGVPAGPLVGESRMAFADIWLLGDTARGLTRLERAMRETPLSSLPAPERPYLDLADIFAVAGRPERARALVADFDRVGGATKHQDAAARRSLTLGVIAIAERRYADAVPLIRAADVGPCVACILPALGIAYDRLGNADSTRAVLERYLAHPSAERLFQDAWFLAGLHRRLGELYDNRNDTERALEHYERFLELWKDADPELRPQVNDVRRRLQELRPVEGRRARTVS